MNTKKQGGRKDRIIEEQLSMEELFPQFTQSESNETCRTCKHRLRFSLNEKSSKIIQCCELQRSKRSNSGYKTIKVTNKACLYYESTKEHPHPHARGDRRDTCGTVPGELIEPLR